MLRRIVVYLKKNFTAFIFSRYTTKKTTGLTKLSGRWWFYYLKSAFFYENSAAYPQFLGYSSFHTPKRKLYLTIKLFYCSADSAEVFA